MVTLRETGVEDQAALLNLLHCVWHEDKGAVSYHRRGGASGCVAEVGGVVVGYAHSGKSSLHPTHIYIGVHVHPDFQGCGIGTALWNALKSGLTGSLKTATYATETAALTFLQRCDFRVSVETYRPTLNPQHLNAAQGRTWRAEAQALGFELLSMTALSGADLRPKLTQLHLDVYAHTHEHDPPNLEILEEDDFLGDDLNPAWPWVARQHGELVGVSSVRLTDDPGCGELGWQKHLPM